MPLELGVFLGAKRYGDQRQRAKSCLILERERYRYQKFCSDLSGQDIRAHGNRVETAIAATRNWLLAARPHMSMPGAQLIARRYIEFRAVLPRMCKTRGVDDRNPPFLDYRMFVTGWREENPVAQAV